MTARLLLPALALGLASGQSPGTFTAGGDLTSPRAGHDVANATLLTNSKVLFVGNGENDGTRADAELYDPSAGTPRADGTVLISGSQRLNQINVRVPAGIAPGSASARMNYLSRLSNEVSLTVQWP